jgi:hypothetical protein
MKINENSMCYRLTSSEMPQDGLYALGCICEFINNALSCTPDGAFELSDQGRSGLATLIRLVKDGLMEAAEAV